MVSGSSGTTVYSTDSRSVASSAATKDQPKAIDSGGKKQKDLDKKFEVLNSKLVASNKDMEAIYDRLSNRSCSGVSKALSEQSQTSDVRDATSVTSGQTNDDTSAKSSSTSLFNSVRKNSVSEVSEDYGVGTTYGPNLNIRLNRLESVFPRFDAIEASLNNILQKTGMGALQEKEQDLYGCRELRLVVDSVKTDLKNACNALDKFYELPAYYAQVNRSGGIRNREEITMLRREMEDFIRRLENSIAIKDPHEDCTVCGRH